VKGKLDYLQRTMHRSTRDKFDEASAGSWSKQSEWLGLEILSTAAGNPEDSVGKVEFVARYKKDDKEENHHEIAHFKRDQEKWYFVDGKLQGAETFVRAAPKVGRNEPCPCGSGKKYKKCCG
jgi:SEC-C motif-containing protein